MNRIVILNFALLFVFKFFSFSVLFFRQEKQRFGTNKRERRTTIDKRKSNKSVRVFKPFSFYSKKS